MLYSVDHLNLALNWYNVGHVHPPNQENVKLFEIDGGTIHKLIKVVFKHPELAEEKKMQMMNEYLGTNNSDLAINMRYSCIASLPDPEKKEVVWNELIDPSSTYSIYQRKAKMQGFYSWHQIELCRPYFDKFFETLSDLESNHIYKYVEVFFSSMIPNFEIEDRHIVKLLKIK